MTDTRFETVFEDTDDLLGGVDVDEIGDVETLLMFLLRGQWWWRRCGTTKVSHPH